MEKKKSNGLVVAFIVVLVVAVIGIGGTIYFYNKSLKDDSNVIEKRDNTKNTRYVEVAKKFSMIMDYNSKDTLFVLLEKEFLDMLPIHSENSGIENSYEVKDLTDNEKEYFVWNYIHKYGYNGNTEHYLKKILGKNYKIEEFALDNNFILSKENDRYVANVKNPTELEGENIYRVTDCKLENDKLIISFDSFLYGYGIQKQYNGEVTFLLDENNWYLEKVVINSSK